jgi:enhancing lycopene biosynthesis protein 2
VCQRGHRLEEAWTPQARDAAAAARHLRDFAGNGAESGMRKRVLGHAQTLEAGGPLDDTQRAQIAGHLEDFAHNGAESGMRADVMKTAQAFKPRPPQVLKQRGQ